MTDHDFDILDELYFVTSYTDLKNALTLPDKTLNTSLQELVQQGYVKVLYPDPDTVFNFEATQFESIYHHCYYLATKAGLIAHNSL